MDRHEVRDALIAADLRYRRGGPGGLVAAIEGDGPAVLLDPADEALLKAAAQPCTVEVLAARLREEGWEDEALAGLPGMIADLAGRGLVRGVGELLAAARSAAPESGPGPAVEALAIPTRDRPSLLARALDAWAASASGIPGELPEIVILDDSLEGTAQTRDAARAFAARYPARAVLIDGDARRRFSQALAPAAGRAAAFALGFEGRPASDIGSYGAARNLGLLVSAGRPMAMADDDTLPDFRLHPGALPGLALSPEGDPRVITPFGDSASIASWAPHAPGLGCSQGPYRMYLGRLVRDIMLEVDDLDFSRANPHSLAAAIEGRSRVAALCFGSWGDGGMGSNLYLLAARGEVGGEGGDVYSPEAYRRLRSLRTVFRAPRRASIGSAGMMGMHIALDSRTLLPPFSPAGRDEDGLWAGTLECFHPDSLIVYLPHAVFHDPPEARTASPVPRPRLVMNELLRALAGSAASRLESGPLAYIALGRRLSALAAGPRRGFAAVMADSALRLFCGRIQALELALDEFGGEPAEWAADVEESVDRLAVALESPRFWLPVELAGLEPSAAEAALVDYVLRFGELLQAWPAMFEEARRIAPELLESARLPGPR